MFIIMAFLMKIFKYNLWASLPLSWPLAFIFIPHKWSPYEKSSLTFLCLIENTYPHFQRLQVIHDVLAFFSFKRNQKPLALAKHSHWSEGSLKLICHQRKPHFLSSFLSLSPQWRGHWWEQEYITKRSLEFLLGLFKKLHPTRVHKTSHFTIDPVP